MIVLLCVNVPYVWRRALINYYVPTSTYIQQQASAWDWGSRISGVFHSYSSLHRDKKCLRHDVRRQLFNGTYCIHDVIRVTSYVISGSIYSPQGYTNGQWRSFFIHMDISRKNLAQNFWLVTITLIIYDNLELKHCIYIYIFKILRLSISCYHFILYIGNY